MVYVTEPDIVAAPPGYTYSVPGPLPGSRFVVTEPAPTIVAEPTYVEPPVTYVEREPVYVERPQRYVVDQAPRYLYDQPRTVVSRPRVIAPREPVVVAPSGIVNTGYTTGYSTVRSCFTDLAGRERCY
jgi:hypothetical protein